MSDDDDGINKNIVNLFGDKVKKPKDPTEDLIIEFNKMYAATTANGRFFILKEENGDWVPMSRKEFIEKHENFKIQSSVMSTNNNVIIKDVPATKIWLESPKRRTYNGIVFDPSERIGHRIYNTWKGFATRGIPGNCTLTLNYIHDIICNNDDAQYKNFMQFWAHMVQKPWEKPEFAIVLIGDKGVGKTFMMDIIETLIDGRRNPERRARHCWKTSNSDDLFGRFRDHLQSRIALLLEEVTWGGDKRHEGTLKDYITGRTIKAEKKNGPKLDLDNMMRIMMAANQGWAVPASQDERRYLVIHVNNSHQQDHEHFAAIKKELNDGGYEALMYILDNYDISDFNCRHALRTEALQDQIRRGQNTEEKWWEDILMGGMVKHIVSESKEEIDGSISICTGREILRTNYYDFMKKYHGRGTPLNKTEFGIKIREFLPLIENDRIVMNADGRRVVSIIGEKRITKEELYCYILPSLAKCRWIWDFRLKRKFQWPEPMEWEQPEYSVMRDKQ